jgi:glycosyltransferase involved in cell wall biosynthesis
MISPNVTVFAQRSGIVWRPMRVLAYIHTFNDADVIERMIAAVLRQTRVVDEILVVDNASTDDTLLQPCLQHATLVRHSQNLGTSGAICTGMHYALERGYDWIWIFDPDGLPGPDALEKLLDLYTCWPPGKQNETAFITCLHPERWRESAHRIFTWRGLVPAKPTPGKRYYPCDNAWWSGCLYRMDAVRKFGLPNADYVLDWGESEYGYRMTRAGFKGFVCQDAPINSNIRGYSALRPTEIEGRDKTSTVLEHPPFRCYYTARNRLYFTLYDYARFRPVMLLRMVVGLGIMMIGVLLRPGRRAVQMRAFCLGIWHGLTGNIAARY